MKKGLQLSWALNVLCDAAFELQGTGASLAQCRDTPNHLPLSPREGGLPGAGLAPHLCQRDPKGAGQRVTCEGGQESFTGPSTWKPLEAPGAVFQRTLTPGPS